MTLNTFKCNYLTPLHFKGLNEVSGPRISNELPEDVVLAKLLSAFPRRLKTFLFQKSNPRTLLFDILLLALLFVLVVTFVTYALVTCEANLI